MGDEPEVTGKGMPRTTRMRDGYCTFLRHNWKSAWYTKLDGVTPYSPRGEVWEERPGGITRITFE